MGDESGLLHLDLRQMAMEHLVANPDSYSDTVFTIGEDNRSVSSVCPTICRLDEQTGNVRQCTVYYAPCKCITTQDSSLLKSI